MLRGRREVALEPVRIVVELRHEEFQTLNAAIGPWVAPADYLRILALRVIAEAERDLARASTAPGDLAASRLRSRPLGGIPCIYPNGGATGRLTSEVAAAAVADAILP
jgi:hypothetical protein